MPDKSFLLIASLLMLLLLASNSFLLPARAELTSCTATVADVALNINQTSSLSFTINNTAANDMKWVRMSAPSENFQIIGGSASGWSRQLTSATVITFTSGILPAGESQVFTVSIQTGLAETPAASWTVTASDQADGSGTTTCAGNTAVGIGTDVTAPVISQVTAASITQNQVSITWTTDEEASSLVEYGTTTAYGSNSNDNNLTASHSRTLTGLTAATTYHYRVSSTDAAANTATSGDKTFTTSAAADVTSPVISGISVTNITASQAVISWTTNEAATSVVDYGLTALYGFSVTTSGLATFHQVTVTGLAADKSYHYKIKSADSSGNLATSADNIFSTASASTQSSSTSSDITSSAATAPAPVKTTRPASPKKSAGPTPSAVPVTPVPTPPPDLTPPRLQLDNDFSIVWDAALPVTGEAWDASGVAALEYSIDSGRNWLPVDTIDQPRATKTTFSFIPAILTDGNYELIIRAADGRGNQGLSPVFTIVFDHLPPQAGPSLYFTGSHVLLPDEHGVTTTAAGLDHKVILAAIGGPTSIDLIAQRKDEPALQQMFSLVKNPHSGLWSGTVSFATAGLYDLTVKAIDGAKNETIRTIQPVRVLPPARVMSNNQPVQEATLTVYTKNEQGFFHVWDGLPYGQANPQTSSSDGAVPLFLPPGTYYLKITHNLFRAHYANIFSITKNTPLSLDLHLTAKNNFLKALWPTEESITLLPAEELADPVNPFLAVVGTALPALSLSGSAPDFNLNSYRGQPAVISLLTSWSPFVHRQLQALDELNAKASFPVLAILLQETPAEADLLRLRGGYQLPIVADPLGELINPLFVQSVPQNLILNRHGIITNVLAGPSSFSQLNDNIKP